MSDDGFRFCDELGPKSILHVHEPAIGLKAIVVVDNVAAGPSIGGLRMAPDVSLDECFRLARAMTFKNAAAGLPHGGGKAVIVGDAAMNPAAKEMLIRAFARAIEPIRDYIVGPDMGTDETAMAWIHDEIGRSVGLPREIGGIPLDEIGATGHGLVAAADSRATLHDPKGLDVRALIALKERRGHLAEAGQGAILDRDAIVGIDCDIWISAARPDVIRKDNVGQLKAKLVLQGANIGVTEEAERMLHERGVVCVPDFIGSAGGVICAAVAIAEARVRRAMGWRRWR